MFDVVFVDAGLTKGLEVVVELMLPPLVFRIYCCLDVYAYVFEKEGDCCLTALMLLLLGIAVVLVTLVG